MEGFDGGTLMEVLEFLTFGEFICPSLRTKGLLEA